MSGRVKLNDLGGSGLKGPDLANLSMEFQSGDICAGEHSVERRWSRKLGERLEWYAEMIRQLFDPRLVYE
jgi:hypothetical protein